MSVIVSNPIQICQNPLNKSKSKQLYSFSKTSRFPDSKKQLCDKQYEIPNWKSDRKTSLGIGKKYDFTQSIQKTPAPNEYKNKTIFDQHKEQLFGWSFGENREKLKLQGIYNRPNDFVPGPGNYRNQTALSNIRFSFRPKTKDPSTFISTKNPGPGQYPFYKTINRFGSYHVSKYESSKATTFNPSKLDRLSKKQFDNKVPGPGHYDNYSSINKSGSYFVSRFQNSKVRSFSQTDKNQGIGGIYENTNESGKIPGPGSYQQPSDFGQYQSKVVNE